MGMKIYAKTTIAMILLAALAACGNSKQLETEKRSLQTENETLKAQVKQLTDDNTKLKAELEDLKQTDQYLFSKAKELASSNVRDARELLDKLLTRFPNSAYKAQAAGLLKDVNSKIAIADAVENGESEISSAISGQKFDQAWATLRSIKKYISTDKYIEFAKKIDAEQNKPISLGLRDLLAEEDKYNGRRIRIGSSRVTMAYVSTKSFDVEREDQFINIDYENMQKQGQLRRIDRGYTINYVVGIFKKGYMWGGTYISSRIEAEEIGYTGK